MHPRRKLDYLVGAAIWPKDCNRIWFLGISAHKSKRDLVAPRLKRDSVNVSPAPFYCFNGQ